MRTYQRKQITAKGVDETDIGKVQVGQKATFTVDAYANKTFEAIVSNISQTDINDSWSKDSTASARLMLVLFTIMSH